MLDRVERYGGLIEAPVREHTEVERLAPRAEGWVATTSAGPLRARAVVSATGPFQRPYVPPLSAELPPDVVQVHASRYRNPDSLPAGGVLVVGGGASGFQIAEELLANGRALHLSVSRHRRMPRRYRGRDLFWWLDRWGFMDRPRDQWPGGRMPGSLVVTGVGGGHDVDVRRLRADGAAILGRLLGVDGHRLTFADDAEAVLAEADLVHDEFVVVAEEDIARHGLELPRDDRAAAARTAVPAMPLLDLRAAGITSVVWCTGYRHDLGWIDAPVVDDSGRPVQVRGVTSARGLVLPGPALDAHVRLRAVSGSLERRFAAGRAHRGERRSAHQPRLTNFRENRGPGATSCASSNWTRTPAAGVPRRWCRGPRWWRTWVNGGLGDPTHDALEHVPEHRDVAGPLERLADVVGRGSAGTGAPGQTVKPPDIQNGISSSTNPTVPRWSPAA